MPNEITLWAEDMILDRRAADPAVHGTIELGGGYDSGGWVPLEMSRHGSRFI